MNVNTFAEDTPFMHAHGHYEMVVRTADGGLMEIVTVTQEDDRLIVEVRPL